MLDENYEKCESVKWIFCHGCENWFHSHCILISDLEYEEIMKKEQKWFCHDYNCQRKENDYKCQEKQESNYDLNEFLNLVNLDNDNEKKNQQQKLINPKDKCNNRYNFSRKCKLKKKSSQNALDDVSDRNVLSDRVICDCGFLAKNNRGLKVHMRKHERENLSHIVDQDPTDSIPTNREVDSSFILNEFSLLLNKCRTSVPLTRIIQKSV